MTPPPINIDGTTENYSTVTIDGQDVEQITIDGQDVLSAIPDSVDLYWPADEGSGTTLNPDIGSVTMTLPSDSWVSDPRFVGGTAPDLTNNFQTDSNVGVNQTQFTVIFWTSFDSYNGDFLTFAESGNSGDGSPSEGWRLILMIVALRLKLNHIRLQMGSKAKKKI